ARLRESEYWKAESEKMKDAYATLKTNPNDPAANLTVGRYLFIAREDYDEGVKFLAKGADPKLKDAAEKDIKAGQGGEAEEMAAADAWYALATAKDVDPIAKPAFQVRAHHWYTEVLPDATGLNKNKAEKRAAELLPTVDTRADKNAIFVEIRKAVAEKQY